MALLSEGELREWGRRVGAQAEAGLFLGLSGPVGAGKSTFARAFARGAGILGPVPSPTFALLHRYERGARPPLIHADLYRIQSASELLELGWEETLSGDSVSLIEWPERARGALPSDRWLIELSAPLGQPELREAEARRIGDPQPIPRLRAARLLR